MRSCCWFASKTCDTTLQGCACRHAPHCKYTHITNNKRTETAIVAALQPQPRARGLKGFIMINHSYNTESIHMQHQHHSYMQADTATVPESGPLTTDRTRASPRAFSWLFVHSPCGTVLLQSRVEQT